MGTATADFIRVGVQVEFTAEVDEQHNVEEKISQLTVFAPGKHPWACSRRGPRRQRPPSGASWAFWRSHPICPPPASSAAK